MAHRRLGAGAAIIGMAVVLGGCSTMAGSVADQTAQPAMLEPATKTSHALQTIPPPRRKLDVAVYEFPDLTGQHKPNVGGNFADFSRAVTQGGADILVDVLREAGNGTWFDVVERRRLPSLLQERQIIETTRTAAGEEPGLQALRFAGVLLEGGIVGYDTDETTGGAGARFLGIGAHTQYRRDIVTVALRAVSVQTGRVLASVTTTKTIYSVLVQGTTFKFVGVDELLEIDAGFSRNHPTNLAVREAIQLAVYALIHEGAREGLWEFADPVAAAPLITKYTEARSGQRGIPEFEDSRAQPAAEGEQQVAARAARAAVERSASEQAAAAAARTMASQQEAAGDAAPRQAGTRAEESVAVRRPEDLVPARRAASSRAAGTRRGVDGREETPAVERAEPSLAGLY